MELFERKGYNDTAEKGEVLEVNAGVEKLASTPEFP